MSTHPYIPLYVDDYEAATTHLTAEEDGIYNRLLRLCWRTPGCSLPNDPAWIARRVRVQPEDYDRLVSPLLSDFFSLVRGRFVQRRLKAEYENISRKKSARVNAGKMGGRAKALNAKENAPSNASDLPADTRAFPEPEPYPEEANASSSPPKRSAGSRGTRLPDDWTPSPECQAFAQTEGLTPQETAREAASFRDYWIGRSGREAIKLDWPATWRNWIRRCDVGKRGPVKAGGAAPRRNGSQPSSMAGILAERRRQAEGANDVSDLRGVFRAG